ncbi:glycosyltransferase [Rhizobium rhizogenes]|uniref:glycosyltransferase family 2 protein n=1 Tax=Rhizobium rhizogenes TaxID=359 RepID=UPI003ECFDC7F
MTDAPTFTILLPVHRPPHFLPHALRSVQLQRRNDFELFVVCDGAPQATVDFVESAAKTDSRIKLFNFPKGERHGEAHRHTALANAQGRFCCQIADDDLWLPHHLEEIELLLTKFEFGNLLHTYQVDENNIVTNLYDIADPLVQNRMCNMVWNVFGPTVVGYRLETYRKLPVGWSPAPEGLWTDLAMWRKFLTLPGIKAGSRISATSLHFPAGLRKDWSTERRQTEIAHVAGLLESTAFVDSIKQSALLSVASQLLQKRAMQDRINAGELTQKRLSNEAAERQKEIEELNARIGAVEAAIGDELASNSKFSSRLAAADRAIDFLTREAQGREKATAALRDRLSGAEAELASERQVNAEIAGRIAAMEASRSWRITAPFRRLRQFSRR